MAGVSENRLSSEGGNGRGPYSYLCIVKDNILAKELASVFRGRSDRIRVMQTDTEGLGVLLNEEWDAVLLEIRRGGKHAFAPCARIRRYWRGPLMLLLASSTASGDVVRGYEMGADAYVTVPFDTQELLARLDALMRRSQGIRHVA